MTHSDATVASRTDHNIQAIANRAYMIMLRGTVARTRYNEGDHAAFAFQQSDFMFPSRDAALAVRTC